MKNYKFILQDKLNYLEILDEKNVEFKEIDYEFEYMAYEQKKYEISDNDSDL